MDGSTVIILVLRTFNYIFLNSLYTFEGEIFSCTVNLMFFTIKE